METDGGGTTYSRDTLLSIRSENPSDRESCPPFLLGAGYVLWKYRPKLDLPDDCWGLVFEFLHLDEVLALRLVSRRWSTLAFLLRRLNYSLHAIEQSRDPIRVRDALTSTVALFTHLHSISIGTPFREVVPSGSSSNTVNKRSPSYSSQKQGSSDLEQQMNMQNAFRFLSSVPPVGSPPTSDILSTSPESTVLLRPNMAHLGTKSSGVDDELSTSPFRYDSWMDFQEETSDKDEGRYFDGSHSISRQTKRRGRYGVHSRVSLDLLRNLWNDEWLNELLVSCQFVHFLELSNVFGIRYPHLSTLSSLTELYISHCPDLRFSEPPSSRRYHLGMRSSSLISDGSGNEDICSLSSSNIEKLETNNDTIRPAFSADDMFQFSSSVSDLDDTNSYFTENRLYLPSLVTLSLEDCPHISFSDVSALASNGLPSLKRLTLSSIGSHFSESRLVLFSPSIRYIRLHQLASITEIVLDECPCLESLELSAMNGLDANSLYRCLTSLPVPKLEYTKSARDPSVVKVSRQGGIMVHIRSMLFDHLSIPAFSSVKTLRVEQCTRLKVVFFERGCHIRKMWFRNLEELERFEFVSPPIDVDMTPSMRQSVQTFETLDAFVPLDECGLDLVSKGALSVIRSFRIEECPVLRPETFSLLLKEAASTLRELWIRFLPIPIRDFPMDKLRSIFRVVLHGIDWSDGGGAQFAEWVKTRKYLAYLDISGIRSDDLWIANTSVRTLLLRNSSVCFFDHLSPDSDVGIPEQGEFSIELDDSPSGKSRSLVASSGLWMCPSLVELDVTNSLLSESVFRSLLASSRNTLVSLACPGSRLLAEYDHAFCLSDLDRTDIEKFRRGYISPGFALLRSSESMESSESEEDWSLSCTLDMLLVLRRLRVGSTKTAIFDSLHKSKLVEDHEIIAFAKSRCRRLSIPENQSREKLSSGARVYAPPLLIEVSSFDDKLFNALKKVERETEKLIVDPASGLHRRFHDIDVQRVYLL